MTKAAGLRKTVHPIGAADAYPSIGCGFFVGCHEVEIGKINAHEAHTRCGNYTVKEYLDNEERGRVGTHVVGIVDEVTSHGCTGAIGFLLFCANGAYKFDVGDIFEAAAGDFRFGYEFNGVGTLDVPPYTLCKVSQFIGRVNVPGVFEFGVTEELPIFQGVSGFAVDDSVGTVVASGKEASGNAVIVWVGRSAPAYYNAGSNAVNARVGGNIGVG